MLAYLRIIEAVEVGSRGKRKEACCGTRKTLLCKIIIFESGLEHEEGSRRGTSSVKRSLNGPRR